MTQHGLAARAEFVAERDSVDGHDEEKETLYGQPSEESSATEDEVASASKETERVKITISLSPEVAGVLRDLAAERGVSMTEVLRQAITTEKFLADAIRSGEKILLREPRKRTTRELVFR